MQRGLYGHILRRCTGREHPADAVWPGNGLQGLFCRARAKRNDPVRRTAAGRTAPRKKLGCAQSAGCLLPVQRHAGPVHPGAAGCQPLEERSLRLAAVPGVRRLESLHPKQRRRDRTDLPGKRRRASPAPAGGPQHRPNRCQDGRCALQRGSCRRKCSALYRTAADRRGRSAPLCGPRRKLPGLCSALGGALCHPPGARPSAGRTGRSAAASQTV